MRRLFADPEAHRRGLVTSFSHRAVGEHDLAGLYFDLSDTPGVMKGPPVWPGQDTGAILAELDYSAAEIATLIESGVVVEAS